MKKIRIIFIAIILVMTAMAGYPQSLQDYLREATENNPKLKSLFNEYMASLEEVSQAGSLPDPQLTFGYFIEPMETLMGNQQMEISLMQMFPWFGMLKSRKDEGAQMAKAKYQSFLEYKNQLLYQVKDLWFEIYLIDSEIRLLQENIEILRSLERLALTKFRSGGLGQSSSTNQNRAMSNPGLKPAPDKPMTMDMGVQGEVPSASTEKMAMGSNSMSPMGTSGSMADVLRAQMEIRQMESRMAFLIDSRYSLVSRFNNLLNRSHDERISVPDTLELNVLAMERLSMYDSAMNANPMVKMYDYEINAFEAQKKMAGKEGLPMIGAGINYMYFSPASGEGQMAMGSSNMFMPMISVTIPINRRKYKAMVRESEWRKEGAVFEQAAIRNEISAQWHEGIRDLEDAERRIVLYQELGNLASQTLRLVTAAYSASGSAFEEVLQVRQQLNDYQLNLVRAIVDQNESAARLEMLAAVHIN